jgi:hypothetical protein
MPRYFFHIYERGQAILDDEGVELDGIDAAREEATVAARELMSADVLSGLAPESLRC